MVVCFTSAHPVRLEFGMVPLQGDAPPFKHAKTVLALVAAVTSMLITYHILRQLVVSWRSMVRFN